MCSNMADPCQDIMTGRTIAGNLHQYGGGSSPGSKTVCWDVISYWTYDQIVPKKLDPSIDGVAADDTGIALHFANGDECRNAPRTSTFNMICDENESPPGSLEGFQDERDSCHFIVNWRTKVACSGAPATTTSTGPPVPKWGVNGTFQGDLECLAPTNDCTLQTTDNQLRGDCENMKLVTVTGGKYEVWEMEFEECGGYYLSGTMTGSNTDMKFKVHGSFFTATNKLEIEMVDNDFPYQAMYKLTLDRIDDIRRLLSLV